MIAQLNNLAFASECRYFTAEEKTQVVELVNRLPQRIKLAEQVEAIEDKAIRAVIDFMQQKYPNLGRYHDQAWAKAYRDIQLVLRYNVQAMVMDDVTTLNDKLIYWLRTILASANMTPQFVRDTYVCLRDNLKRLIDDKAYAALVPFLDSTITELSNFPEPATPMV